MDDELVHRLEAWVDGYVRAWNSNDPAAIGALFSEDAAYYTEPYRAPWRGREEIVRQWLDRKDEPGGDRVPMATGRHRPRRRGRPGPDRLPHPAPQLQQPVGHPTRRRGPLHRVHRVVDAARLECLLEVSGSWWAPRSSKPV